MAKSPIRVPKSASIADWTGGEIPTTFSAVSEHCPADCQAMPRLSASQICRVPSIEIQPVRMNVRPAKVNRPALSVDTPVTWGKMRYLTPRHRAILAATSGSG